MLLVIASALLIPTAALVAVLRQWKLCLYSLGMLFLLVGVIEAITIQPLIGLSKMVSGGVAVGILYVSAKDAFSETQLPEIHAVLPRWEYLFESVVAAVAALGALLFARTHPLFALSAPVTFSWAWLGLVGIFMTILATNMFEVGMGLLVFFAGLDILLFSTSISEWWAALLILSLAPIGLSLVFGILSAELSRLGHSLRLDALKEKAPFIVGQATPVRIRVRRRRSASTPPSSAPVDG